MWVQTHRAKQKGTAWLRAARRLDEAIVLQELCVIFRIRHMIHQFRGGNNGRMIRKISCRVCGIRLDLSNRLVKGIANAA